MLLLKNSGSKTASVSQGRCKDINGHISGGKVGSENGGGGNSGGGSGGRAIHPSNSCLIHPNSSHLTRMCEEFRAMTVEERGKIVKDSGGCKFCLSTAHKGKPSCPFVGKWRNCDVDGCQEPHSRYLHGCTLQSSFHMKKSSCDSSSPLLLIQAIETSIS